MSKKEISRKAYQGDRARRPTYYSGLVYQTPPMAGSNKSDPDNPVGRAPSPAKEASQSPWRVELTVIIPMYNEEQNVSVNLDKICTALKPLGINWEIVVVDDGSIDNTAGQVKSFAQKNKNVRLVSYSPNQGRGKALRVGFDNARGEIICTIDADLSYNESHIPRMYEMLKENPNIDLVVGSPYMKGGQAKGVPAHRLWISKIGNKILGFAMRGNLSTVTGMLRAYRRDCIKSIELESDGKEIHLEILSKAMAMGYKAKEMPAVLGGRAKGKSKFKFRTTAISHIIFSFYEKPMILFGFIGLALMVLGFLGGLYIVYLWQVGNLNPDRPLMTLMVLLILIGMQVLLFGFIGTQLVHLKREIYKTQRENKQLENKLGAFVSAYEEYKQIEKEDVQKIKDLYRNQPVSSKSR
jgi:dolichol-phosphate mannosyltransferase